MPRTWALISTYQSSSLLRDCLESIRGGVDRVHMIDGAFRGWPGKDVASDDGTRQILEDYSAKYPGWLSFRIMKRRLSEVAKRTATMEKLHQGDVFLIIDADEKAIGDLKGGMRKALESEADSFIVKVVQPNSKPPDTVLMRHPRVIRYRRGMRYRLYHWRIVDREGNRYDQDTVQGRLSEFHIVHRRAENNEEYKVKRLAYNLAMMRVGWQEW